MEWRWPETEASVYGDPLGPRRRSEPRHWAELATLLEFGFVQVLTMPWLFPFELRKLLFFYFYFILLEPTLRDFELLKGFLEFHGDFGF